jgi:hypothetical protein
VEKFFQAALISASKARGLTLELATLRTCTWILSETTDKYLTKLNNIPRKNTLAYSFPPPMMKKNLITLTAGTLTIQLFRAVIYGFSK